jgi:hypothetical protein
LTSAVSSFSVSKAAEDFKKFLDNALLPNKVISNLLSWTEFMKLPDSWQVFLAVQRHSIKVVSTTFALPHFFIKQIKLYEACEQLKKNLTKEIPAKMEKIVSDVKNVFFASISSIISTLKIPHLLHKTEVIDLSKVSRALPNVLSKTVSLFSLAFSGMKLVDTAWTLQGQFRKERAPSLTHQLSHPSAKVKALYLKLGTGSLIAVSNSINAASLFLGVHINPIVSLTVATVSLTISVFSKFLRNSRLFGLTEHKSSLVSLPA